MSKQEKENIDETNDSGSGDVKQEAGENMVTQAEYEEKIKELNDKYLRLYSEFDNYRKRTARERSELVQTAGEDVFKSLLTVLDDFERAIRLNKETDDIEAVKNGVGLIYHKLRSTLTAQGLQEMDAMGQPFDPDIHEAITNIPATDETMKGKVVDELEKGYALNGKIIRFAKVVIGQ